MDIPRIYVLLGYDGYTHRYSDVCKYKTKIWLYAFLFVL
jgi:hypothetical protein